MTSEEQGTLTLTEREQYGVVRDRLRSAYARIGQLEPSDTFVRLLVSKDSRTDPGDYDEVRANPEFWATDYAHAMNVLVEFETLERELHAQLDRADKAETGMVDQRLAHASEMAGARQRIVTLEAALREYGGHRWDCPSASYRDRGGELQPGDGPCRCGLDAALAAQPAQGSEGQMSQTETARELLGRLRAEGHRWASGDELARRVERVLALHREYRIYDECGHEHQPDEPGVIEVDEVGLTCKDGYLYSVCYHCETDDGVCREDSDQHEYPCETVRLLNGETA